MQRTSVESSSIASVGYDATQRVLEVEFRDSGDVYQYLDVPAAIHEALLSADSLGRFLNSSIKGVFGYRRA
ncbi:MAG: KTSC domain-containing protein [Dehalococcoidia bacterium]|nr:KTSC domain-containing protein [Dehalococcoidia bacterium]